MKKIPTTACLLSIFALSVSASHAIILFGKDNSGNTTDPVTGVPWDSVGRLSNLGGTIGGSAVYLGNGYVLTAGHVGPYDRVTFDGTTFFYHDGVAPEQVPGNVDMKVLHLTTMPTVGAVTLYTGISENTGPATHIGWGVGRDPSTAVGATVVPWGNASTSTKRWGLNGPEKIVNISYGSGSYQAIATVLGKDTGLQPGLGADESATTLYDSGSGLFQYLSGQWQLIGLATAVETGSTSTFGDDAPFDPNGNENYFVRISSYADGINSLIPEPSALLLSLASLCLLLRRRR